MALLLQDVGDRLLKLNHELELEQIKLKREEAAIEQAERKQELLKEAGVLVNSIAESIQQKAHENISQVVTRCLQAVFDDPYEFRIIFERKRGKTEARLVFIRDGLEIDPLTAAGGGVLDVASLGLRLACLVLSKPRKRRILILDEPYKFVSRNYLTNMVQLLETLAREMDVQIIMVTHSPDLEIGKVIEL